MMDDSETEKDRQALRAVQRFCEVPYGQQGTLNKMTGLFHHDWAHLVQIVFAVYRGQWLDVEEAKSVAEKIRGKYPNDGREWDQSVRPLEAKQDILRIIKSELELPPGQNAGTPRGGG
jgi:hypothetical protein